MPAVKDILYYQSYFVCMSESILAWQPTPHGHNSAATLLLVFCVHTMLIRSGLFFSRQACDSAGSRSSIRLCPNEAALYAILLITLTPCLLRDAFSKDAMHQCGLAGFLIVDGAAHLQYR